jgi:16S rRNA (guanine1207-N2)-methyltransferase
VREYYAFRTYSAAIGDRPVPIVGKPGVWSWDRLNPGTAALLEVAEITTGNAVLDLGCGTGVLGVLAAHSAQCSRVVLVDCSLPATTAAERTVDLNATLGAEVLLADGVRQLSQRSFDVVLCHLPRGRALQQELIDGAAWVLRPGGRFYLVASKRSGIKGAIKYARAQFGRCAVLRQKQGYHVALATHHGPGPQRSGWTEYCSSAVLCDGVETTVVGKPGIFAWDRVDEGTAALIGSMKIGADDCVLDLGCGTGLAGLAASRHAHSGAVVLVDADIRAVEAARRTLEVNGAQNAEVLLSDCAQAARDRRFDVVVTNPPFHLGVGTEFDVAHQFVRDAWAVLRPAGRLYLVANRHLRYTDVIAQVFGAVTTAFANAKYQVLAARA